MDKEDDSGMVDDKNTDLDDEISKMELGDQATEVKKEIDDDKESINDAGSETDSTKSNEDTLNEEIEKLRDEKLRLLAEMENLRKRSDRDRVDSIRYGSINLARDILSPDDNLTRALDAIPLEEENSESVNNLIDGLKMVQKEFSTILEKYGVNKIKALNKKFDHNFHQAMIEIETDEAEPGFVIQEIQSGYTMHEKLLRPSMVGVSKKKEKNN
jgi:molecular chaperone GrpE